jgi:hypothetical protein
MTVANSARSIFARISITTACDVVGGIFCSWVVMAIWVGAIDGKDEFIS